MKEKNHFCFPKIFAYIQFGPVTRKRDERLAEHGFATCMGNIALEWAIENLANIDNKAITLASGYCKYMFSMHNSKAIESVLSVTQFYSIIRSLIVAVNAQNRD